MSPSSQNAAATEPTIIHIAADGSDVNTGTTWIGATTIMNSIQ